MNLFWQAPSIDPSAAQEIDVPSSSMRTEDIDTACDISSPGISEVLGEPECGLTGGETCADATMVSYFAPIGY